MKIGLIDVDSHNFPNLSLMKISAYHKAMGDSVEWCVPLCQYDIVYQCKVFGNTYSDDITFVPQAKKIIKGGTGYAIEVLNGREIYHPELDKPLPYEIEHQYPDYSLYPDLTKDTAYGFLTRGCCNSCEFCIVSKKEGCCSKKVADLSEFWNGQKKIKLLDPNLLACKEQLSLLKQLSDSQAKIDFTQGLDARFITKETAKAICECNIETIHFAFDFMKNESKIIKGLTIFKEHFTKNDRALKVYVLTNFNTTPKQDWYRVNLIKDLGYQPYVMIYQKGTQSKFLSDLQRWSNSPYLFNSTSFQNYVPRKNGKTCGEMYANFLE